MSFVLYIYIELPNEYDELTVNGRIVEWLGGDGGDGGLR